jgi:hypothetical protein
VMAAVEALPRYHFTDDQTGSVSFDCVNGENVHLAEASVMRRVDRVHVWFRLDLPLLLGGPRRQPIPVRKHPFCGVMRRRGILTLFGADGSVLAEDLVRVETVKLMPDWNVGIRPIRASCYRYHPRPGKGPIP